MSESTKPEFSKEEKAAMKERARELKAQAGEAEALKDVLAKIEESTGTDRELGYKLHEIITTTAPELKPKTWYGSPAYYLDGKNIVFFQPASKFKVRYLTLGFNEDAALDDGAIWPTSFAVTKIGPAEEKMIAALVTKAVGR